MSKLSAVIVGLVGIAVGLFLGLAVAALTADAPPAEPVADSPSVVVESNAPGRQSSAGDWGPLHQVPDVFGPGTSAFDCTQRLASYKGIPSLVTLANVGRDGRAHRLHFDLSHSDGDLLMEAIAYPFGPEEHLEASLQFRPFGSH